MYRLLLFLFLIKISSLNGQQQCQAITYYECKNIGYNQTSLPNKFNHQDQKDVALVVRRRKKEFLTRLNYVIPYRDNYPCHLSREKKSDLLMC
jgi:hypothetical protein